MLKNGLDADFIGNFFFRIFDHPQHLPLFFFLFMMLSAVVVFTVSVFHPSDPTLSSSRTEALKEALMEHPRRQARHEEEWREAVERIHERLLQESGRRFFGNERL